MTVKQEPNRAGNALVTGGYGFIGSHVATRLETSGYRVLRVGRGTAGHSWKDAFSAWDLSNSETGLIVHCAGPPTVGAVARDPVEDFRASVVGLMDLVELIAERAPQFRFVFCSSAAVYGNSPNDCLSESQKTQPVSAYGTHKLVCELLLQQRCRDLGLHGAIVRLFSVYGEGLRKQLLWDACNKLHNFSGIFHGTGDEERDFIHVEDAVEVLLLGARKASPQCPIVNGGTGVATSVREVLAHIASSLGTAAQPTFTGIAPPNDPRRLCADSTLLRSWGFAPQVSWEKGVDRYLQWFLQDIK